LPQLIPTIEKKAGLPYWMDRVLEEHSKVGSALHSDAVHDFRISLRRCILIAEIMEDLDPSCGWKAMRKMGRQTFQRVGALRDTQVLMKWIERMGEKGEVSAEAFLDVLKKKQEADKNDARAAVREFDRKQWRAFRRDCAKHHRHVVANRPACESILLANWERMRDLNRSAQRSRSLLAYHRLRVGVKKFRYAAENFLPSMYTGWAPDLKIVQDLLGEIHDLTVLDQMLAASRGLVEVAAFTSWREKLEKERAFRLEEYRSKMSAKSSLLRSWRDGLPAQKDLRSIGLARLGERACFATPDFSRVRRMARLSLQIYDGLANCGLMGKDSQIEERFILQAAALLQETGKFKGGKAYHKESYRMIRKISPPPGWSKADLEYVALVARFHRRALPYPDHAKLRGYELPLRQSLIRLAAILRMANAFHAKRYKAIRRLHVENGPGYLVIRADGFHVEDANDRKVSEARRFLEFVFQGSVHLLAPGTRMMMPKIVRASARSDAA
jgi:CHAD domain-containing protein